ncbi:hypothetical protein P154DRAFT_524604 [Amniculicola lignicola CBS 123094]|uniref:Large ribosomal subunit protein bL28m n=1 Tax=Amniculicola lignicola CBS 123094 TaxID=1392246 RepID=A0A6A5WC78_9PLEO|nr:hypothetical protein P154DRAFT_524604 [Amniculicola lignicola CBS 123094]
MPPRLQSLSRTLLLPREAPRSRCLRAFTTSPHPQKKAWDGDLGSHLPKHVIQKETNTPPYPHGPNRLFKQSNRGLYGGQMIQFGNNVSPDTETKTRRHWTPNVLNKALYSVILKKKVKLRITAKVLKIIDREGGLDNYLLKDKESRIKELGPLGWDLRCTLLRRPAVIMSRRAEAAALGIDQEVIERTWPLPEYATAKEDADVEEEMLEEEAEELYSELEIEDSKLGHSEEIDEINLRQEQQRAEDEAHSRSKDLR